MSRAKNWCITLNNYTDECLHYDSETMNYLICGLEVGEKGTKHIQGYVQLKKQMRLTQVKDLFVGAHLEVARGKPEANVNYCSKEQRWHDHGVLQKGQGARNDLLHVKELIDGGKSESTIREEAYGTYIRYHKSIVHDIEFVRAHRSWCTKLYIHWGDTGTGKSKYCAENFPNAYWKSRGDWWDGYEGHEIVIIDEFYGWMPISMLLRAADRYPMQVPIKGGFRKFVAKEIHVTSNREWKEWWPNVTNQRVLDAFERRITESKQYRKLGN